MRKITVVKSSSRTESCMNCGNERTTYLDSDGSRFCRISCIDFWHGHDGWDSKSSVVEADHALAIAENYERSMAKQRETQVYVVRDFDCDRYKGVHLAVCATEDVAKQFAEKYVVNYKVWENSEWKDVDFDDSTMYRTFTVNHYGATNETHEIIITRETLVTEYVMSRPIA